MSTTTGNIKNLDVGRTEVLHSLLSSLGHADDSSSSPATLSAEQLQKLSDKIDEILGDRADHDPTIRGQPSQLISEDGLPIIEISEPINEDSQMSTVPSPFLEQDLTPLSLLSDERERQRQERDRILDMLEEEERLQQLQEERDAEKERRDAIRKRTESMKAELVQLKAAREVQKRMGLALVQHVGGTGDKGQDQIAHSKSQITSSAANKSVSFADTPTVEADQRDQQTSVHQPNWGDVIPGRLRAQNRVPLVGQVEAQKYPMRMHVVERRPAATPTSLSYDNGDSDDESNSSTEHLAPRIENDFSGEEERPSSSSDSLSDNEPLEEEFDYDTAQHHREIALEYHKKRHAVGAETTEAMAMHALGDYEQHETSSGQSPLSRFRADRMTAVYDRSQSPVSTSTGQTVIPVSRQKSLRNSVRLGKLEGGQLVGGDSGESESEDETIKEVIQMLQAGNIQNTGPDFKPTSMSTMTPSRNSDAMQLSSVRTRPSRFKLAHGGRNTGTTTLEANSSRESTLTQPTISSLAEQNVPRSFPGRYFPINKPHLQSLNKTSELALHMPVIIDSLSFPFPSSSPTNSATIGPSPSHQTQPEHPPSVKSSVMQGLKTQPQNSMQDPLSIGRPTSKLMDERGK